MPGLLDFLQAASNAAASNITGPIDLIGWAFNKAGVPVGIPVGGSEWMKRKGLMKDVPQSAASLAGETVGLLAPIAAAAKAPQIAAGVIKGQEATKKGARAIGERAADMTQDYMASQGLLQPATVWHGSPHKFDKFDSTKIGTGEGAQAYGHGLYLAESPEVAGQYQRALADKVQRGRALADAAGKEIPISNSIDADALAALDMVSSGKVLPKNHSSIFSKAIAEQDKIARTATDPNAVARAAQVKQRLLDLKNSGARLFDEQSNLYKVDLPDEAIARMLDWDKPLSQQAPEVRKAVLATKKQLTPDDIENLGGAAGVRALYDPANKIDNFLGTWESLRGKRDAGEGLLRQSGIPGIRYLDGGSRGAGQGTSNYVVFSGEEGLLKILERNGVPLK